MFRNYLAAAIRNLLRNRLYTVISVGGLAVAFAAALLIAIFVGDEFSYDKWIPGAEDAYFVTDVAELSGGRTGRSDHTPTDLAAWMRLDFPQIQAAGRLDRDRRLVRHGQVEAFEALTWGDPEIFTILPLPTVAGDLKTALAQPDGVVLTRTLARKYFGTDAPIGRTLLIDKRYPMRVTAVIEDLPSNTHLRLSMVASAKAPFSELGRADRMPDDGRIKPWSAYTYIRLHRGQSIRPVIDGMPGLVDRHLPLVFHPQKGDDNSFVVTPLAGVHFSPGAPDAMATRGDRAATWSVALVGGLIVLMAAVNFVNLMTARAGRRAVEVGVRKLVGADRSDLIVQFIGEALLYAALAGIIALAGAEALMPGFNAFLGRHMAFPYALVLPVLSGMVVLIGVLAGAYPAMVLSGFRPAGVLKGELVRGAGGAVLRQGLVALQFAVLIGLVVATVVIWRQTVFATRESLRLNSDQMLMIYAPCVPDALEHEIAALPGVSGVACSQDAPLSNHLVTDVRLPGGRLVNIDADNVGFGFFELYGLKPLAGRFFSQAHGGDAMSAAEDRPSRVEAVVVNQTAARELGYANPADAVGKSFPWTHNTTSSGQLFQAHPARIIGVVDDFPISSIRSRIEPTAFYVEPDQQTYINVKLKGRAIPETSKALGGVWRKLGFPGRINAFFLDQIVHDRYRDISQQGQLFGVFAGIAIFIACLGLVGLAAFATERRTKEVGIRKAVGASAFDVLKLFLWQFTVPVLWANLVAWPLAFLAMSRWLQGFAYSIPLTVWPFALAAAAAVLIAWLTVLAQASRAARARPVTALRYE
ncbi:MAG TPA: ABC transporter permease [Caulobacteraceae bacterium]|nr:ABC transporter permease [Caulobacteraceae bacterium]